MPASHFSVDQLFYFGSFNPPTRGHFWVMAESLKHISSVGGLLVVPSYQHVWEKPLAEYEDRCTMLQLGLEEMPVLKKSVRVSRIEHDKKLSGYTIDTIKKYHHDLGGDKKFGIIVGADTIKVFNKWRDWQELLQLVEVFVFPRAPMSTEAEIIAAVPDSMKNVVHQRIHPLMSGKKLDYLDVSSVRARKEISETGKSKILSPAVLAYIRKKSIYLVRSETDMKATS